jgi:hypothetical protein
LSFETVWKITAYAREAAGEVLVLVFKTGVVEEIFICINTQGGALSSISRPEIPTNFIRNTLIKMP